MQSRVGTAIATTTAPSCEGGEATTLQPDASPEPFDDDGYDGTDLLPALEAAEPSGAPLPLSDVSAEYQTMSLSPVRPSTAAQPKPAPKPKRLKSMAKAQISPVPAAASRRSSRSAAATSAQTTITTFSENTGPSQLDRTTEASSTPGTTTIVHLTDDNLPPADSPPRQSSSCMPSDTGARRVGRISLSRSSPLLIPTFSPADTRTHTNVVSPSDSRDAIPGLISNTSFKTRHGHSPDAATTVTEAPSRQREAERGREVDVFGNVSTVVSATVTPEEDSRGKTSSTRFRPATIQLPKFKPSLQSPPLPDLGERPSKRARFNLPSMVEPTFQTPTTAFGTRKPARESLNSAIPPKENRTMDEIHSVSLTRNSR